MTTKKAYFKANENRECNENIGSEIAVQTIDKIPIIYVANIANHR